MAKIIYWDEAAGAQQERDMTPDEEAELAARIASAPTSVRADMDAYLAEVRTLREMILNRLAGIGVAALAQGDQSTVDACVAARQRLLDITKIPAALAATNRAELEAAIEAEYAAIIQSVPENLINAFDQVDQ